MKCAKCRDDGRTHCTHENDDNGVTISTDGDLAIGIGGGLTFDTGGHLGINVGGISIPFS